MKILFPAIVVAAAGILTLHSQMPVPAADDAAALQQIKADNAVLIERQQKTLEKLEEMLDTARQLKMYTKRG